jgi:hypothetical protein
MSATGSKPVPVADVSIALDDAYMSLAGTSSTPMDLIAAMLRDIAEHHAISLQRNDTSPRSR